MKITSALSLLLLLIAGNGTALLAAEPEPSPQPATTYHKQLREMPRETLFDVTFGSPPPLVTERGILIIEAYHDLNANQQRDPEEPELTNQVSCRVGERDYQVPAFIPGLGYNETYTVACTGEAFQPHSSRPDVFIEKRGQIIRLELPCVAAAPQPQAPAATHP